MNRPTFLFQRYIEQGWMGVDLFFVLSGFLITGILLDTREARNYFTGFYARRILRIFPLYYLVLIGIIATSQILSNVHAQVAPAIASQVPLPQDRWVYFCFLTNWIGLWKQVWGPGFGSILAHFWSLAVEEQFYLFWPLMVWIIRPRAIPWVAGILAMSSAIIRLIWVAHSGAKLEIAFATVCRLDALFIGALCACFFRDPHLMRSIRKWLPSVATLGIGSFFLAFSAMLFFPQRAGAFIYGAGTTVTHTLQDAVLLFLECGGYSLLALGFGALVLLAAYTEAENNWMQRILKSRFLAPIGAYSYGLYVFHVPILGLAGTFIFSRLTVQTNEETIFTRLACVVVLAAASFIVSAISYEFFEKRILSFKRFFTPKYTATQTMNADLNASGATLQQQCETGVPTRTPCRL